MKLTICLGSESRLKGSSKVVGELRNLITTNGLSDKVTVTGTFNEAPVDGVAVWIDEELFSVTPDNIETFFKTQVLERLGK